MKSYGAAKLPVNQDSAEIKESTQEQPEPATIYTKSALVTVEDVVAFGSGPGTDALQGVVESTDVFKILRDEL
jgi:alkaline phosphatase